MSVLMLEKQMVDGVIREIGETVTSDTTTESVLVAHGKASAIAEIVEQPKPAKAPAKPE